MELCLGSTDSSEHTGSQSRASFRWSFLKHQYQLSIPGFFCMCSFLFTTFSYLGRTVKLSETSYYNDFFLTKDYIS